MRARFRRDLNGVRAATFRALKSAHSTLRPTGGGPSRRPKAKDNPKRLTDRREEILTGANS